MSSSFPEMATGQGVTKLRLRGRQHVRLCVRTNRLTIPCTISCTRGLGVVYTGDFKYASGYDSVNDLLPKVSSNIICDVFMLKRVDRPL
jgi:hypothetical protein